MRPIRSGAKGERRRTQNWQYRVERKKRKGGFKAPEWKKEWMERMETVAKIVSPPPTQPKKRGRETHNHDPKMGLWKSQSGGGGQQRCPPRPFPPPKNSSNLIFFPEVAVRRRPYPKMLFLQMHSVSPKVDSSA